MQTMWDYGKLKDGRVIKLGDLSMDFVNGLDVKKILNNAFGEVKKVYRLGPPAKPTYHRDPLTPTVEKYFEEGAFYCTGTTSLANEWKRMGDSFTTRPLYEITLKNNAVIMFYKGWSQNEKVADDLTEVTYTTFDDEIGPVLDPEECQLVVKLSDVVSVREL